MSAKCVKSRQRNMEGALTQAVDINCVLLGIKLQLLMHQACRAKFISLFRGRMIEFYFCHKKIERSSVAKAI